MTSKTQCSVVAVTRSKFLHASVIDARPNELGSRLPTFCGKVGMAVNRTVEQVTCRTCLRHLDDFEAGRNLRFMNVPAGR